MAAFGAFCMLILWLYLVVKSEERCGTGVSLAVAGLGIAGILIAMSTGPN